MYLLRHPSATYHVAFIERYGIYVSDQVIDTSKSKLERLTCAIMLLSNNMHEASTRPCTTCQALTELLNISFGCCAAQARTKHE